MTIIEFFDKAAIENVLSALLCGPDRVVYIGDSAKKMNKALAGYRTVLEDRGNPAVLECQAVNKNDLRKIVEVLSAIVEQDGDCVFNLDGGEDLCLVAVGMVAQKYPDRVKLHRFNVRNNTVIDCDADGNNQIQAPVAITVEENIRIYGGAVIYHGQLPEGTRNWEFSGEFCRDVAAAWELCRVDPGAWNSHISLLDRLNSMFSEEDPLHCYIGLERARAVINRFDEAFQEVPALLEKMMRKGLISGLWVGEQEVEFDFKNAQVKRFFSKAGQVLELAVAVAALEAQDGRGEPVYHDVMTGVYLDWDGALAPHGTADVGNEIDVLLMKGAVPVFISCKNGDMDPEELFKLAQVAQRFGAQYAKCVLVATQLDKLGHKGQSIRARAGEMGIQIVDDLTKFPLEQCGKRLRNLWNT